MCPRPVALRALLAFALFTTFAVPAFAQRPEVEKLASELAQSLFVKYGHRLSKTKVAVGAFRPSEGGMRELGFVLAGELERSLTKQGKKLEVLDIKKLREFIVVEKIPLAELLNPDVWRWLGRSVGADVVLLGVLEATQDRITLRVRAERAIDNRKITEPSATLLRTIELERLLSIVPTDIHPGAFSTCSEAPLHAGVLKPGKDGVGFPECVYCPAPSFTDEGRRAKFNGIVRLCLTVGGDGKTSDILVEQGAPFGLNRSAVELVKSWRFKPATDRDRKAVPVRVIIELTFRLL